jgi:hypothetical protein
VLPVGARGIGLRDDTHVTGSIAVHALLRNQVTPLNVARLDDDKPRNVTLRKLFGLRGRSAIRPRPYACSGEVANVTTELVASDAP